MMNFEALSPTNFTQCNAPTTLLSRADLKRRWRCGSHAFFQRAEADGLLIARRYARTIGYRWEDVWNFEGGQPKSELLDAYRADLLKPEELALMCPLRPKTLILKASDGEIPHRRVGRFVRFVPVEAQRWLESWS